MPRPKVRTVSGRSSRINSGHSSAWRIAISAVVTSDGAEARDVDAGQQVPVDRPEDQPDQQPEQQAPERRPDSAPDPV